MAYESLEPAGAQPGGAGGAPPAAAAGAGGWQQERHLLPALRYLGDLLSWHFLSEDSVWRELKLMQVLSQCVAVLRWCHHRDVHMSPQTCCPGQTFSILLQLLSWRFALPLFTFRS